MSTGFSSRFENGGLRPGMHLGFKDLLGQHDIAIDPDRPSLAQLQEGLGIRTVLFALGSASAHPESLVGGGYFAATEVDAGLIFSRLDEYRDGKGALREVAIETLAGDALVGWGGKPEVSCLTDLQMHYTSHDGFFFRAGTFAMAAFGIVYDDLKS